MDGILIENDLATLVLVKHQLNDHFSIKDLGEAEYILEIRIYRDRFKRIIELVKKVIWIRFLLSSACITLSEVLFLCSMVYPNVTQIEERYWSRNRIKIAIRY